MSYKAVNELTHFEFHDSCFHAISFSCQDMVWELEDAIVIGTSRLDIEGRQACTLNTGADRYATPFLRLTFQDFQLLSFIREGCATLQNGIRTEIYPPKELMAADFPPYMTDIAASGGNTIYYLNMNLQNNVIHMDFWGGSDPEYYIVEFITKQCTAEWEAYGKEAWYLEHKWQHNQDATT